MKFQLPHLAYIGAGIVTVLGIVSLAQPVFVASLFGLAATEPRGLSQIRGTFGAMYMALGGIILYGALRPVAGNRALGIGAVLVSAVAAGRLISLVVDHAAGVLNILFLLGELAVVAMVVAAMFAKPRVP